MRDFLEREIKVGDTLVYPVRQFSSMWLTKITVTDLSDETVHGTNDNGRRVTVSRTKRSVIVEI